MAGWHEQEEIHLHAYNTCYNLQMHIYIYLFIYFIAGKNQYVYNRSLCVCVQVGIICEFVYYVPHVRIYMHIWVVYSVHVRQFRYFFFFVCQFPHMD